MKIALGADSYGFDLKQEVKNYLLNQGLEVEDVGVARVRCTNTLLSDSF